MAEDELEATLLLTALGEEFQMVDAYSKVRELCHNTKVMGVLEILITESKAHASKMSEIILELSSKHSFSLDEVGKKVAELAAGTPEFKLSDEALEWYKWRTGGLVGSDEEELMQLHEFTSSATMRVLDVFSITERKAYSLYRELSGILESSAHRSTVFGIAKDELRHEFMLNNLVAYQKSGKEGEEEPKKEQRQETTLGMLYCLACRKMYADGADKCTVCGDELGRLWRES